MKVAELKDAPPEPKHIAKGSRVSVRWEDNKYYPATVIEPVLAWNVQVKFDDGTIGKNVPENDLVCHESQIGKGTEVDILLGNQIYGATVLDRFLSWNVSVLFDTDKSVGDNLLPNQLRPIKASATHTSNAVQPPKKAGGGAAANEAIGATLPTPLFSRESTQKSIPKKKKTSGEVSTSEKGDGRTAKELEKANTMLKRDVIQLQDANKELKLASHAQEAELRKDIAVLKTANAALAEELDGQKRLWERQKVGLQIMRSTLTIEGLAAIAATKATASTNQQEPN